MHDEPMSLKELNERSEWTAAAILDIRDARDYAAGHLSGSVSIPIDSGTPESGYQERLAAIFLPPRSRRLVVADDDPQRLRKALAVLSKRDRGPVVALLLSPNDPLPGIGMNDLTLWRPVDFLVEHIGLLPLPAAGPVLDLGAGSGRSSVWLALQGYRVTAVDHLPDALALATRLADDRGIKIVTLCRDLCRPGSLPQGPWAAVMAFRFLDREMLRALPGVLQTDAVVMVRTFRWDRSAEILPRRKHCLEAGELMELFPEPVYEILHHVENLDPDGRPAAGIVARFLG